MMSLENAERLADLFIKRQALRDQTDFQTPGSHWYRATIDASNVLHIAIDELIETMNND